MDLALKDMVAVVTGASKGIGLAVARTLHEEGALVVAASRRPGPELTALAGERLMHVPVDLFTPDGPAQAVARAQEVFGRLDVLVNNAGGPPPGAVLPRFSFTVLSDADWHAMLEFNLMATVRAVRAAIPLMLAGGGGSIVNVSSTHAVVPGAVNVDYGVAKAGVNNLTQALSEEFGPQGIRVNTVSPGPVRTPWWTDEGGAADVLAAAMGTDRDTVLDGKAAGSSSRRRSPTRSCCSARPGRPVPRAPTSSSTRASVRPYERDRSPVRLVIMELRNVSITWSWTG